MADLRVATDPTCPWAWLTSRWLLTVAETTDVELEWGIFSLGLLHLPKAAEERRSRLEAGLDACRLLTAARRSGGQVAFSELYTALGDAIHERGETLDKGVMAAALVTARLASKLLEDVADPAIIAELESEHAEVAAAGAFGVPTLRLDGGPAFFGPIVDRRLNTTEAALVWTACAPLLRSTAMFELKRERIDKPAIGRHGMPASGG